MALQSQMMRETRGRRHMSGGRKRRGLRALMLLLVLGAVGVGVYLLMGGGGGSDQAVANQNGEAGPTDGDERNPASTSQRTAGDGFQVDVIQTGQPVNHGNRPAAAKTADSASRRPTTEPVTDAVAANPAPQPDRAPTSTSTSVSRLIEQAQAKAAAGDLLAARELYNKALHDRQIDRADAAAVRQAMGQINQTLVFSPRVVEGDPYAAVHVVKAGELISRFAPRYDVPWQVITRINNVNPRRVPAGARLKVVKGPFHVIVDKSDYRADLYLGDENGPQMFVRSFNVGLGEFDSTPLGSFIVKKGSKLENPPWNNPRTGEFYHADDPENPLGEHWVGLRGTDENTAIMKGYGLHGTIEPDTIGTQASMGCVRMLPDDIHLMFDCLSEEQSIVYIVP